MATCSIQYSQRRPKEKHLSEVYNYTFKCFSCSSFASWWSVSGVYLPIPVVVALLALWRRYTVRKGVQSTVPNLNRTRILCQDVVIKWKYHTRYCPFVRGIHRSPVNSPYKGQWHGALMFSLICAWGNGLVNNRSLWRHCNVEFPNYNKNHWKIYENDLTHWPLGYLNESLSK